MSTEDLKAWDKMAATNSEKLRGQFLAGARQYCMYCISNYLTEIPGGIGPGDVIHVVPDPHCNHPKHEAP